MKTPVDQQFLLYSDQSVWNQQPFHVQSHLNPFLPHSDARFELQQVVLTSSRCLNALIHWRACSQEFHSPRHMCCGDVTIKVIWSNLIRHAPCCWLATGLFWYSVPTEKLLTLPLRKQNLSHFHHVWDNPYYSFIIILLFLFCHCQSLYWQ